MANSILEEVKEEPQNVRSETSEETQNQNKLIHQPKVLSKIERSVLRLDASDI